MFSSRCVLAVRQVHVADHVNDPPVGLLGQALVLAAVACLHVEDGDVKALRADGGEAAVGLSQHQSCLRTTTDPKPTSTHPK